MQIQTSLPSRVRNDDEGLPFLLGSGASCTVLQHETGSDTESVVPAGTIVALKKYLIKEPLRSHARNNSRRSLQMIWHDMRIHCHPCFRSHENFCRLLYLGWEYGSLIPVLALEIADFGTLQSVMQSECKMSMLQTCNVSLDIAVGLHALHAFGFAHGDLKPGNVLLQTHATRQIVAKLTDFAGVINSQETSTSSIPPFVTPLWLAPEVLTGASLVDWQKVDVYTFGLILAQIWCHVDLDLLDCFLEARIPKQCPAQDRKDVILYYKICPQNLPESALSQCLDALKNVDLENHGPLHRSFAAMIRQSVLREPAARAGMNEILSQSADLASYCSRPWRYDCVI
jgi:serine/threonine protein kinase